MVKAGTQPLLNIPPEPSSEPSPSEAVGLTGLPPVTLESRALAYPGNSGGTAGVAPVR
jgi:hypothetical protein